LRSTPSGYNANAFISTSSQSGSETFLPLTSAHSSLEVLRNAIEHHMAVTEKLDKTSKVIAQSLTKKDNIIKELNSKLEKAKNSVKWMTVEIVEHERIKEELREKIKELAVESSKSKDVDTRNSIADLRAELEEVKTEAESTEQGYKKEVHRLRGLVVNQKEYMQGHNAAGIVPKNPTKDPGCSSSPQESATVPSITATPTTQEPIKNFNSTKDTSTQNQQSKNEVIDHSLYKKVPENHANEGMLQEMKPRRVTYDGRTFDEVFILNPIRGLTVKGKEEGVENIAGREFRRYADLDGAVKLIWTAGDRNAVFVNGNEGVTYLRNVALKEVKLPNAFEI
jgi:hypothetical protein